jgi:hypothetical protein
LLREEDEDDEEIGATCCRAQVASTEFMARRRLTTACPVAFWFGRVFLPERRRWRRLEEGKRLGLVQLWVELIRERGSAWEPSHRLDSD